MDDLSVIGDLLFGPDETAAAVAAAGARAQSLLAVRRTPSVFSYSAGAQGPCVPLCPRGVFSQELSPSSISSYDQGFSAGVASAASWANLFSGEANGWNSVDPLSL